MKKFLTLSKKKCVLSALTFETNQMINILFCVFTIILQERGI